MCYYTIHVFKTTYVNKGTLLLLVFNPCLIFISLLISFVACLYQQGFLFSKHARKDNPIVIFLQLIQTIRYFFLLNRVKVKSIENQSAHKRVQQTSKQEYL